jgi:hypothetical protein
MVILILGAVFLVAVSIATTRSYNRPRRSQLYYSILRLEKALDVGYVEERENIGHGYVIRRQYDPGPWQHWQDKLDNDWSGWY